MQYCIDKGTKSHGTDFLGLLREIFVQVTVTGIFLINATRSVRWHSLEGGV